VSATVTRDTLVPAGSVFLFAIGGNQRIPLSSADGTQWHGLYHVRCESSFPLQFLTEWKLTFSVKDKVVPPEPRMIKLIEPPLTRDASFDTPGKTAPKGGWLGNVQYRFVTMPSVQILSAQIEPGSSSAEDIAAAKPISVVTPMPLTAGCGDLAEVRLASSAPRAHGTLVIDTDNPQVPHWQTYVEFSPK
jgi:hypothetical protein